MYDYLPWWNMTRQIITNVGLLTMVEHDQTDIITNVGLLTMVEHDLT